MEAGFDGACPRMRCMCCPRVVCEGAWAPLVDSEVVWMFQRRAATLLSIQVQVHKEKYAFGSALEYSFYKQLTVARERIRPVL